MNIAGIPLEKLAIWGVVGFAGLYIIKELTGKKAYFGGFTRDQYVPGAGGVYALQGRLARDAAAQTFSCAGCTPGAGGTFTCATCSIGAQVPGAIIGTVGGDIDGDQHQHHGGQHQHGGQDQQGGHQHKQQGGHQHGGQGPGGPGGGGGMPGGGPGGMPGGGGGGRRGPGGGGGFPQGPGGGGFPQASNRGPGGGQQGPPSMQRGGGGQWGPPGGYADDDIWDWLRHNQPSPGGFAGGPDPSDPNYHPHHGGGGKQTPSWERTGPNPYPHSPSQYEPVTPSSGWATKKPQQTHMPSDQDISHLIQQHHIGNPKKDIYDVSYQPHNRTSGDIDIVDIGSMPTAPPHHVTHHTHHGPSQSQLEQLMMEMMQGGMGPPQDTGGGMAPMMTMGPGGGMGPGMGPDMSGMDDGGYGGMGGGSGGGMGE